MDERRVHAEDEEGVERHRHEADAELVHERVTRREDAREQRQAERPAVRARGGPAAHEPGVARVDPDNDQADPGEALRGRALAQEDDGERDDEERRRAAGDRVDE